MRFNVAGSGRAKAIAKNLYRTAERHGIRPSLTLCQAAVAEALGYASFAELLRIAGTGRARPSLLDEDLAPADRASRRTFQVAALVRRLEIGQDLAARLAAEASLSGRSGKRDAVRAPEPPAFEFTHHWPVRYEGDLGACSPDELVSLDEIIETLAPGQACTGSSSLIEHMIFAEARSGAVPAIVVRYATAQEVRACFARDPMDDEEPGEDPDEESRLDRLVSEYCHPSMRGEG